jgi:hypothetical protein
VAGWFNALPWMLATALLAWAVHGAMDWSTSSSLFLLVAPARNGIPPLALVLSLVGIWAVWPRTWQCATERAGGPSLPGHRARNQPIRVESLYLCRAAGAGSSSRCRCTAPWHLPNR